MKHGKKQPPAMTRLMVKPVNPLVEKIDAMYFDEKLTCREIAARLNIEIWRVRHIMEEESIRHPHDTKPIKAKPFNGWDFTSDNELQPQW